MEGSSKGDTRSLATDFLHVGDGDTAKTLLWHISRNDSRLQHDRQIDHVPLAVEKIKYAESPLPYMMLPSVVITLLGV